MDGGKCPTSKRGKKQKPIPFDIQQEEKLILLVAQYAELYNSQDANYANTQRRAIIWREIGTAMEIKDSVCKEQWGKLRDNFRRSLYRNKTGSGQAATKSTRYRLAAQLEFLRPFIQVTGRRRSNFAAGSNSGDSEDERPMPQMVAYAAEPQPSCSCAVSPAEEISLEDSALRGTKIPPRRLTGSLTAQTPVVAISGSRKRKASSSCESDDDFVKFVELLERERAATPYAYYFEWLRESVVALPPHLQLKVLHALDKIRHEMASEALIWREQQVEARREGGQQ